MFGEPVRSSRWTERLRDQEATICVGLARNARIAGTLGRGARSIPGRRGAFAGSSRQYFFLARKVLFEAKASQRDESDRFLREAAGRLA